MNKIYLNFNEFIIYLLNNCFKNNKIMIILKKIIIVYFSKLNFFIKTHKKFL